MHFNNSFGRVYVILMIVWDEICDVFSLGCVCVVLMMVWDVYVLF